MDYSIVLSDELLKEYNAFQNNEEYDRNTIEYLLSSYKSVHKTNIEQMLKVGIQDESISQAVISSGIIGETIEELVEQTKYKLILDKEKIHYPYINIFADKIENNYSATYYKNEDRSKAQKHIKALVKNANYIFIYDKHMSKPNSWDHSKKFFTELLPRKSLTICYPKDYKEDHLSVRATEIKTIHKPWTVIKDSTNTEHRDLHDRYIVIDSKIEIILTSGFDNLFDERSDFTYIVRDIEK